MNDHPFHVHFRPRRAGELDAYSSGTTVSDLQKRWDRAPFDDRERSWEVVRENLVRHMQGFVSRVPIRVAASVLLEGLDPAYEQWIESELGRIDYEPLYGKDVAELRKQLDARVTYRGVPSPELVDAARDAVEDMRLARNIVFHHMMTSTFRIVLSRVVSHDSTCWSVITARDTDRQDVERLDWTAGRAVSETTFEYHGAAGALPSSSLESFWHCHETSEQLGLDAGAILHCHALVALDLDARARKRGLRIDDVLPGATTVQGISRHPEYGKRIAEAMEGGADLVFRPGEGVWVVDRTAQACATKLLRVLDAGETLIRQLDDRDGQSPAPEAAVSGR